MSKTISAALKTHLAGEVTTLAVCLKLTRQDAAEYFFTDHDVALTIDNDVYEPTDSILPSAVMQNTGLAVDNMEIIAFLKFDKVVEVDIAAGLFDGAQIDIFIVNYNDLSMGVMYLAQGWSIGAIDVHDNTFTAEVRGKAQKLQQHICELYTPECRAELGDSCCGIDLADSAQTYWYPGAVTAVTDRQVFTDSNIPSYDDDVFTAGKLTWLEASSGDSYTGNNAGFEMEVKTFNHATGEFTLFEAMPNTIEIGDEFIVTFGCDKAVATCKARFNNVINFRGEPFIPGWDRTLDVVVRS